MASSNRVRITMVRENTAGSTPDTPRMRTARWTGEALNIYTPTFVDGEEINSDRMNDDPTEVFHDTNGPINVDVSYPADLSPASEMLQSMLMSSWTATPSRDNDGTADSVITDIGTSAHVATCTTGPAFVVGHLVQFSGNKDAPNNLIARCTTGSATVPAFSAVTFTADAAPAATSRMKAVGLQGVASDIIATSTGLGSTTLDFTTFNLQLGQTIKIGGTATGDRFATAALNTYATIAGIGATALTLANLPAGWEPDAGTGKTIKVWFGDTMKNGLVQETLTIEKGFLDQTVPNFHVARGMTVNTYTETLASKAKVKGVVNFMGMQGSKSTTSLDATPDPVTTSKVFASNVNVGRVSEGGALIAGPNFCKSLEWTISNNFQAIEDITIDSPAGNVDGQCDVSAKFETYYGDSTYIDKFFAGTPTSIHTVLYKNSQAITRHFPRLTYTGGGNPVASAKNTQVTLPLEAKASRDTLTGAQLIVDRLEYLEI